MAITVNTIANNIPSQALAHLNLWVGLLPRYIISQPFVQNLKQYGFIAILELLPDEQILSVWRALLFFYQHNGTLEGFLRLCQALFGQGVALNYSQTGKVATLSGQYNPAAIEGRAIGFIFNGQAMALGYGGQTISTITYPPVFNGDVEGFLSQFLPPTIVLNFEGIVNTLTQRRVL